YQDVAAKVVDAIPHCSADRIQNAGFLLLIWLVWLPLNRTLQLAGDSRNKPSRKILSGIEVLFRIPIGIGIADPIGQSLHDLPLISPQFRSAPIPAVSLDCLAENICERIFVIQWSKLWEFL